MRTLVLLLALTCLGLSQDKSHVLLGKPSNQGQTVTRAGYELLFSAKHGQALWVSYLLTPEEAQATEHERKDNFKADMSITGSATPEDYVGTGYDKGHLAPAGDMRWSWLAMTDSFFMTNMSPQTPGFNRIGWRLLEEQCRKWAVEHEGIHIITGPVFLFPNLKEIGETKVTVPDGYYKVIMSRKTPESPKCIAFLMPNQKLEGKFMDYVVTVDRVELLTGLDFFDRLPDRVEDEIEAKVDLEPWTVE